MPDHLAEYRELLSDMRHYANMRFAQLSLAAALTGGLFAAAFQFDPPLSWRVRLAVKIAGLVIAGVFWTMEERSTAYWAHFRERVIVLESKPDLQFDAWTHSPPRGKWVSATGAVRVLFVGIAVFWVVSIAVHWQR